MFLPCAVADGVAEQTVILRSAGRKNLGPPDAGKQRIRSDPDIHRLYPLIPRRILSGSPREFGPAALFSFRLRMLKSRRRCRKQR